MTTSLFINHLRDLQPAPSRSRRTNTPQVLAEGASLAYDPVHDAEQGATMGEKIAKMGIRRDKVLRYYIHQGDIWAVARERPGQPNGKAQKVVAAGSDMDEATWITKGTSITLITTATQHAGYEPITTTNMTLTTKPTLPNSAPTGPDVN